MNKIIGFLWGLLCYQLLAGFLYYQHGNDSSAFTLYFKDQYSTPLLILNVGMIVFILLLVLYLVHIRLLRNSTERLPILFLDDVRSEFKKFWTVSTMIAVLVIPWIGFIWMWFEFFDDRQVVWSKNDSTIIVGVYDVVSPVTSFYKHWDDFRYGRIPGGVSYVPFWQPLLIMWPATIIAVVLSIVNYIEFYKIRQLE